MRFKSIAIENVFSYYGLKHFDFEQKNEPIALIVGDNGFGKTSFINSVKIALHGINRDILSIGNQILSKEDFVVGNNNKNFSGILNRKAKLDGVNEAKIIVTIDDDDELFVVERTFSFKGSSYVESLMLYDNKHLLLAEGDDAQDIINQKISPTIARFFFFDGEKIQTIADFSHKEFTKMLEDVLELDIYDQMVSDAEYLIRKINKAELDKELQAKVGEKEKVHENLKEEIISTEESLINEKRVILKEMEGEKRELDAKLKKLKSRFQVPLAKTRESLKIAEERRKELVEQMKQATMVQLPLLLNSSLKEKISKDIDAHYRGKIQIDSNILAIKKALLMKLLDSVDSKDKVSNAFDCVFQSRSENQSVSFADPYTIEQQFDTLPEIDLSTLLKALSDNAQVLKETQDEITALEYKIADDRREYEEDFVLAVKMTEDIVRQTVKCEMLAERIITLKTNEKELKKELGKLTIIEHRNHLANEKIKTLKS